MTIINPNSIAGITSVTAQADIINFYKSNGNQAGLGLNGVNFNTTAGISTFNNLVVGGTLTYEDVKNVDSIGIITARGGLNVTANTDTDTLNVSGVSTFNDNVNLLDNDQLRFGNGNDINILHSGSSNLIRAYNVPFKIQLNNNHESIVCVQAGEVQLYHANSKKFETTSTGVKIDNASTTDMLLLDVGGTNFAKIGHNTASGTAILDVRSEGHTRFLTGGNNERLRITADGPHLLLGGTSDVNEITESSGHAGMVIGGTGFGNAGLAIITSTTGAGRLYFGDNILSDAGRNRGAIIYYHSSDHMHFQTAGSERVRITSAGRVNIGESNLSQTATSLNVTRNAGGTVAGESVIAATMGDNTTMVNAMLTVRNAGNRGDRGNSSGSKLASFEFNNKNALTIDKDGLVQIGGDSGVSGTWHHEVYNDSGTAYQLLAGTQGAWLQLQDTGSSEKMAIAVNGDCNIYSYKNDDSICFNTTTGGTTTQMLKLLGDGNIRWYPDGASGVNLLLDHGSTNVVIGAYKNGSTGTSMHFKNQTSAGSAASWMEVNESQQVSMPYGMGGQQILNLYNTTGQKGLNIFANVSGGNQNSDAGVIDFNGYAQTNGAWIQGTNEASHGKKDLLLGSSWGTPNDYSTRNWDKPVVRLTWGGFVGMHEAATTNAAVTSLLHIKGNSDNGDDWCTLTIEDSDDTAGSKNPALAFDGNGTRQGRIKSSDSTTVEEGGLVFQVGSGNNTVLQINNSRGLEIHRDVRGWATVRYSEATGMRQHVRMHYSSGNHVATHTILRVRRHWWGWGHYKIRLKSIYYNSSLESTFYVNGHGSGGNNYSITQEAFGGNTMNNNYGGTVTHVASNNSPGNSSTWYADIQVNIPNYTYAIVWVEAWSSSYSTDPASISADAYCLM